MELTIDHIASEIMCWCEKDSDSYKDYWHIDGGWKTQALSELNKLFNQSNGLKSSNKGLKSESVNFDFVFNAQSDNPEKRILAGLVCESKEPTENFMKKIEDEIRMLEQHDDNTNNKKATKYLISMYHNIKTRSYLHEKNFIEIFNNLIIGCAIKRIK